jgi:hypothetical protein
MAAKYDLTFVDERTARLEFAFEDGHKSSVNMDSADMDALIENFATVRAAMSDPVPEQLDPIPRLPTTEAPKWWVYDPRPDGHMLALRHPGFGWLGFLLPQESALSLAGFLFRPLAEPLKIDAKQAAGMRVGATAMNIGRFMVGRAHTGQTTIGLETAAGSMLFFAFTPEDAKELAELILAGPRNPTN